MTRSKPRARNLAELRLDYADLVLIHRPPKRGVGEALWQGLRRAKRERLTRDIGVSNYSIEQIEELVYRTGELPAVNQIEWTSVRPQPAHARLLPRQRHRHPGLEPADSRLAPQR